MYAYPVFEYSDCESRTGGVLFSLAYIKPDLRAYDDEKEFPESESILNSESYVEPVPSTPGEICIESIANELLFESSAVDKGITRTKVLSRKRTNTLSCNRCSRILTLPFH